MTAQPSKKLSKQRIWFYVAFFFMGLSLIRYFSSDGTTGQNGDAWTAPTIPVVRPRPASLPETASSTATMASSSTASSMATQTATSPTSASRSVEAKGKAIRNEIVRNPFVSLK